MLVQCATHGDQPAATLCPHLGRDGRGAVVGGDARTATALCAGCDAEIGHVWSRLGPQDVDVVCALCFGEAIASAQDLGGLPHGEALFARACTEMVDRNKKFLLAIDHDTRAGWSWADPLTLAFVDAGGAPRIRCDVDAIGTLGPRGWTPAWADPNELPGVRARAATARALGPRVGLPVLALPEVPGADLNAAWHLAQLTAWLQGAQATYQLAIEGGQAFVSVARWVRVPG